MVENGVVFPCPQERAREHDRVEGDIVLGHELVELNLRRRRWRRRRRRRRGGEGGGEGEGGEGGGEGATYLLRVFPPFFPFISVTSSDG